MLSVYYTKEQGLSLQQLDSPLESWATQRFVLSVRSGQGLHLAPGVACLRLPLAIALVTELELALWLETHLGISLYPTGCGRYRSRLIGILIEPGSGPCNRHLCDHVQSNRRGLSAPTLETEYYKLWTLRSTAKPLKRRHFNISPPSLQPNFPKIL